MCVWMWIRTCGRSIKYRNYKFILSIWIKVNATRALIISMVHNFHMKTIHYSFFVPHDSKCFQMKWEIFRYLMHMSGVSGIRTVKMHSSIDFFFKFIVDSTPCLYWSQWQNYVLEMQQQRNSMVSGRGVRKNSFKLLVRMFHAQLS